MQRPSPLWPAQLHHIGLASPQPRTLAAFYQRSCGYVAQPVEGGDLLLAGPGRRMVLSEGEARHLRYAAFTVMSEGQLDDLRADLAGKGVELLPCPSPLLGGAAFAVRDPDGLLVAFGLGARPGVLPPLPTHGPLKGRLQHVVVTTLHLKRLIAFYEHTLGFVISDRVTEDSGRIAACFFRSDPEHHSYAAFLSDTVRLDHHSLEVPSWNDIRDWGDHLATQEIGSCWGPGRHGPGNNLFMMVKDPDGNMLEISSDLERMPPDMPPRQWEHTARTLNLWGEAIFRI